ncbi:hypothetical protein L6452_21466 [Arctium lappa]|uniref:Uncharacterized protein n=1 Tax=Arctium lappa TaxID=4217 RepID=A0ACB9AXS3_ARCLA|nr:hypothetical protein L6452_21466 [Arctium lappa]
MIWARFDDIAKSLLPNWRQICVEQNSRIELQSKQSCKELEPEDVFPYEYLSSETKVRLLNEALSSPMQLKSKQHILQCNGHNLRLKSLVLSSQANCSRRIIH